MRGQKRHDLELLRGQRHRAPLHAHLVFAEPHLQLADARHALAVAAAGEIDGVLVATDVRLDAQQQLGGIERLRHVVVAAGAEADALVHDVALRRQEDHRDAAALLADARAEIEAVRARQHHVQQQQIGMLAGQQLQPAFRIPRAAERVAVRHQQLLERLPQVALVVDDHDLIHRPPPLSRPRSRSRES